MLIRKLRLGFIPREQSWFHLKTICGQIAAMLRATWALLFWPTWTAAVDWTLLLDERSQLKPIMLHSSKSSVQLTAAGHKGQTSSAAHSGKQVGKNPFSKSRIINIFRFILVLFMPGTILIPFINILDRTKQANRRFNVEKYPF